MTNNVEQEVKKCVRVSNLMTANPISIFPTDSLKDAYKILNEKNIRHLPVVGENKSVKGIISNRDMLVAHSSGDGRLNNDRNVGQIMSTSVDTIEPSDCAYAAAKYMFEKKRGCLLVIKNKILVGILTESDFVKYFVQHAVCECELFE